MTERMVGHTNPESKSILAHQTPRYLCGLRHSDKNSGDPYNQKSDPGPVKVPEPLLSVQFFGLVLEGDVSLIIGAD